MSIQKATNELYRCFQLLNDAFFQGQLPIPAVTIQTKGRRNAMGWCSLMEIWQNKEGTKKQYEINIAAEYLDLEPAKIIEVLLHEMVHLYCNVNEIKDCSRSGNYHNTKYRDAAEQHGLTYETDEASTSYGWAFTALKPRTAKLIESWNIDKSAFILARRLPKKEKKKNNYKLKCPSCNIKLRATKPGITVICKECEVELVEY